MFKLVTVFRTSLGKRQTWSLNNPDPNKSAVEVKDLLQRLTKVKLFHKDGADLFDTVEICQNYRDHYFLERLFGEGAMLSPFFIK